MAIFHSGLLLDLVFLATSGGLGNKRPDGVGEIVAVARFTRTNAGWNRLYLSRPRQGIPAQILVAHSGLQTNWSEMVCDRFSFRPSPHGHCRAARCRFRWK